MLFDVFEIAGVGSTRTTMKKTIALLMVATLWLAGCSSRSEDPAAETVDGLEIGAALAAPGQVRVFSDKPALLTGEVDRALITAVVTDDSNRAVAGHNVSFGSDGGVLQNIQATTNEAGEAIAELSLAGDYRNRNITVTASVDGNMTEVLVVAAGSNITMQAPEDLILGQTADVEFTLLSGGGSPIPNEVISFSSEAGNTFSQNSVITDALGIARVSLSTAAGTDVINATALGGSAFSALPLAVADNIQDIVTPVRVRVISNESTIETGGNDVARITTLVTDESNRVLSGKDVSFASTGGVLQNISSVTNEAGQATAELSLAGDFRNQDITVSASVDGETGEVLLTTLGSRISVAGPTALVSGDIAELEVSLTGGNDQPIANEVLSIRSTAGNTIQPTTAVTNSDGKVNITVSSENGNDKIIVAALDSTVVASHDLQVAADVLAVLPQAVDFNSLPVDGFSPFSVEWTSNGFPVAGQLMRFSITAGNVRPAGTSSMGASSTDVYTDANGVASIEVASSSAGPATIAFSDSLDADPFSQYDVEFVATTPSNVTVDAAPASIATGNSSTVYAIVTDIYGNPVKDAVVGFSSADLRGGSLSPVSATTDKDGKAAVTFNAGNLPTETDGIVILAEVTDFPSVAPSQVAMTITERQLNVIIGLSGKLAEVQTDTRYVKTGVVQVTDGAGRPVPDATILVSLTPTVYRYGFMETYDTDGDGKADKWGATITSTCDAEDLNGNRILDPGEDRNGNGELDPRDPALVDSDTANEPTVIGGQITTDSSGVGFFTIAYPQSNALYFDIEVTARVEALGTEGVAYYPTGLPISAGDVDDVDITPPNLVSPYGPGPAPASIGCN